MRPTFEQLGSEENYCGIAEYQYITRFQSMQTKTRQQLRNFILSQRRKLTLKKQQEASTLIAKQLLRTRDFMRSKRIGFYFAVKGEVSTSLLLSKALALGKDCFLPILHPIKHNQMWFGQYQWQDTLKKNCYGIEEPDLRLVHKIPAWSLDLVIMPLVAFDSKGHRLGMGGGYYDRTFSFLQDTLRHSPKLIGLAYDFQHLPQIPVADWDIPLDYVITDHQIYHF